MSKKQVEKLAISVSTTTITNLKSQLSHILRDPTHAHEPETQIALLKSLENEYQPHLRELSYKKSPDELKLLAEVLDDLGTLAKEIGALSDIVTQGSGIKHYTDSAVFHQYVISILSEKIDPSKADEAIQIKIGEQQQKIGLLKQSMFSSMGIDPAASGLSHASSMHSSAAAPPPALPSAQSVEDDLSRREVNADTRKQYIDGIKEKAEAIDHLRTDLARVGEYSQDAGRLFSSISTDMKSCLSDIYEESERELASFGITKPCPYSVIGLGSVALNQATPYSDFEFAILTQNEDYKSNTDPRVRDYFTNLTHLVHFKVIALGETKIDNSLSHLIHRGRAFDAGGHTPLGKQDSTDQAPLIGTIEEMFGLLKGEGSADKLLPYILSKTCHISGDQALSDLYQQGVSDYLRSPVAVESPYTSGSDKHSITLLHHQEMALRVLREEATTRYDLGQDMTTNTQQLPQGPRGNLQEFRPLSGSEGGKLFNVKQEIYRFERLVHHLGMYFMKDGDSALDTVNNLHRDGIINSAAADHLRFAVTFASMLRLNTYLSNEGQREDLSLFASEQLRGLTAHEQTAKVFHIPKEDLREDGALFRYFYTALEFHKQLEEFCDAKRADTTSTASSDTGAAAAEDGNAATTTQDVSARDFFKSSTLYLPDSANKGMVHYRLMHYEEAMGRLEEALQVQVDSKHTLLQVLRIHEALGSIHTHYGLADKAIKSYMTWLQSMRPIFGEQHQVIAAVLGNLGNAYSAKKDYDKAIEFHTKSLEMEKHCARQSSTAMATSLNNLGNAYSKKGNHGQAIKCYTESLELYQTDTQQHLDTAGVLGNLGAVYASTGRFIEAIDCFTKSLEARQKEYRNQPHPDIADTLNNLGNCWGELQDFDKAIDFHTQSVGMQQVLHQEQPNKNSVLAFKNIGRTYHRKGDYDNAIHYFDLAIKMSEKIPDCKSPVDIATLLYDIGNAYAEKGNYDIAIEHYTKSLGILKHMPVDMVFPLFAMVINNLSTAHTFLGTAYRNKEDYNEAIKHHTTSLDIQMVFNKGKPHPDIAASLTDLCLDYYAQKNVNEALRYSVKALQIMAHFDDHPYTRTVSPLCASLLHGYALNIERIFGKVVDYALRGLDFTDWSIHFATARSLSHTDSRLQHEKIEECTLAWIFSRQDPTVAVEFLVTAISAGRTDLVTTLLETKVNPNILDAAGASPLYYSLGFFGQPINMQIVDLLLKSSANPNQHMKDGDTPMHMAHCSGHKEAIAKLLAAGGQLNTPNLVGKTPLHCLLESTKLSSEIKIDIIVEFLSLYDVMISDKDGRTGIDYATTYLPEVVELLQSTILVPPQTVASDIDDQVDLAAALALSLQDHNTEGTQALGDSLQV